MGNRREAEKPNDIWQADHTLLDIWVHYKSGPPVRPWLIVIMDDYSRAIAGFGLGFQGPSAIQTALILRQAMWRKHLPQWKITGIPETLGREGVPLLMMRDDRYAVWNVYYALGPRA
jgi:putative transposase